MTSQGKHIANRHLNRHRSLSRLTNDYKHVRHSLHNIHHGRISESQTIVQALLHRLYPAYIHYIVQTHTHAADGHVHAAGVPLWITIKPPVASAAGVKGSSQHCGWKAKAPARGSNCPWTHRCSYYLPLCLLCLLSSALQGPPQKVLETQGVQLT